MSARHLAATGESSAFEAISATTNVTFNNSTAEGRWFVTETLRNMLRAYNAEAESCVKTGSLAESRQLPPAGVYQAVE